MQQRAITQAPRAFEANNYLAVNGLIQNPLLLTVHRCALMEAEIGKAATSTRKLSLPVQLSDPADYDGGELVIHDHEDSEPVNAIGSVIVFPSFLPHRMNEVTRGERWSLVAWVHGPPFR